VNQVVDTVPGILKKRIMSNKFYCPGCGYVCALVTDLNDIYVAKINQRVWVDFTNYQCDKCFDSFTTTELDELNLFEINKAIRRSERKTKIKTVLK